MSIRLLCVLPAYEPAWAFGGVVQASSNLLRAMAGLGVDVSVYTTSADGKGGRLPVPAGEPVDIQGVRVLYFPPTWGTSVWDSRAMRRELCDTISRFDIVYVAAIWQWIGAVTAARAHAAQIPYVIAPHGSLDVRLLRKGILRKKAYYRLFVARSLKNASAIHFTTDYERCESQRLDGRCPSFLVRNGLAPEAFEVPPDSRAGLRRQFGLPDTAPVVITVGRADPKKRYEILLEAFSQVVKLLPDCYLVIVGPFENEYARQLRMQSASLHLSDRVVWAGYRSGLELQQCYGGADLFVLPSRDENFCMAAAESMARGVPVVITKYVGIAPDVESHGAGIVTDTDAVQVTEAILSIMAHPDRRGEMARKARDAAWHLYGGESVARLMLQAFEDILSGSRSAECAWQ